jgi:hypothetical protein
MNAAKYRWKPGDDEAVDERRIAARRKREVRKGAPPDMLRGRRQQSSHINGRGLAKTSFITEKAAWNRAEVFETVDGCERSVYRCASCGGWHIGRSLP